MVVLETERLRLRHLTGEDAPFMLGLLNEPSFLRNIGDKGVRTLDDAERFIREGPVASYERLGFGMYLVEAKESGVPVGICGLVKREGLEDVDVGFAFLPAHWSRGYAVESASAVVAHARETLGLPRVVAVTAPHNDASASVLRKLGLRFERMVRLPGFDEESRLFTPAD